MSIRALHLVALVALATALPACALCPTAVSTWGPCPTSWGQQTAGDPARVVKAETAVTSAPAEAAPAGRVAMDDVVIAAQPDVTDWPAYNRAGFMTVVNFRTVAEGADEERGHVVSNAMQYFNIPVEGANVTAGAAAALAKIVEGASNGKVLLHCSSGNRAAAVWAVYLARHQGMSADAAMAQGDAAGITKAKVRAAARAAIAADN